MSDKVQIPDGSYSGLWSGHIIRFQVAAKSVEVETSTGVRGINIPVSFSVVGGKVVESSIAGCGTL